jgi:glycosyltransferase involved in cell wall biosynthesis
VKIAYVGPFLSREGGAAWQRALGIAVPLTEAGDEVFIGSGDASGAEGVAVADGVRVWSLGEASSGQNAVASLVRRFGWGRRTTRWLRNMPEPPDRVLIYAGGFLFARRVMKWAKRANVPVVIDCVEWYDRSHHQLGKWGPIAWDFELAMHAAYGRAAGVICISRYLEDHFRAHGAKTALVPPTLDPRSIAWSPSTSGPLLTITYAGNPGKKDSLDAIIDGVGLVDPLGERVELRVVGVAESELRTLPSCATDIPPFLRIIGRQTRAEVMALVAASDYVPLLRPKRRFAEAGFPTKVVESLVCGTPVICNITSDLAEYVRDGVTGLVCEGPTAEDFAVALRRAMEMPSADYHQMRAESRALAERAFDWRLYTDVLTDLIHAD